MKIADRPEVTSRLQRLDAHLDDIIEDAITICEVPAPPFAESRRAAHVAARITALGLGSPRTDAVGNVIRELPGAASGPTVMVTAHLDTVFGAEVPIVVRRDGHRLAGPGIGDNSMALAAMLWLGVTLADLPDRGTLVMAANVGEEGLGNLRGQKALWEQFGARADAWVILEGGTFNRAVRGGRWLAAVIDPLRDRGRALLEPLWTAERHPCAGTLDRPDRADPRPHQPKDYVQRRRHRRRPGCQLDRSGGGSAPRHAIGIPRGVGRSRTHRAWPGGVDC